jgi:hypothetical protein
MGFALLLIHLDTLFHHTVHGGVEYRKGYWRKGLMGLKVQWISSYAA